MLMERMESVPASLFLETKQLRCALHRMDRMAFVIRHPAPRYMSGYPQILWITLCVIVADLCRGFWGQELSGLVKKSPANYSYLYYLHNYMYLNNKTRMKVFCAYSVAGWGAF